MNTPPNRPLPSVLLADDQPDVLELLALYLSGHFSVDGAVANGRSLVEAALATRPDVIVSDVTMPELGGVGAMAALRDRGLETPFVMVSAEPRNATECLARGAAGFVFKPDVAAELVPAVRAALGGRHYVSKGASTWCIIPD
jgi:DNA-binding NarL/FixJ family response regulator